MVILKHVDGGDAQTKQLKIVHIFTKFLNVAAVGAD